MSQKTATKAETEKLKILKGTVVRRHDIVLGGNETGNSTVIVLLIQVMGNASNDYVMQNIEVRGPATQHGWNLDQGLPRYEFLATTETGDEVEFSYQPVVLGGYKSSTHDEFVVFKNLTLLKKTHVKPKAS